MRQGCCEATQVSSWSRRARHGWRIARTVIRGRLSGRRRAVVPAPPAAIWIRDAMYGRFHFIARFGVAVSRVSDLDHR